ncbi:hypothetical protein FRC04_006006 [Tulasnella sp. 424]|nr:hypothetical protein FRC04_006006 [Tulasnella sp. 424]KAG8975597.1 hypothetical protein FRC05_005390 [Tulasnella sp. 425]
MSSTIQVSLLPADVLDVLARSQDDDAPARKKPFHGRKLPANHIPRPRNAFILFRTNFVEESKLTRGTEADHRNISKIAGAVWRALPPEEKLQWHRKALEEKEMHKRKYPNYKYTPVLRREGVNRRKVKQKLWEGIDSDHDDNEDEDMALAPTSCPSTSAPLPPTSAPTSFTLQGLESFEPEEDESGPASSSLPMLTASADVSPPSSETMTTPYSASVSSPLNNNNTSSPPLPTKGPRDRCDVIAELYAKGWRGEQLEAEVRRREEEGRKRRGGYEAEGGGVESKPATIVTRSRATIREERKADNDTLQGREVKPKPPPKRVRKRTRKSSSSEAAAAQNALQQYASTSTSPFTASTCFPPVHRVVDEDYDRPLEPEVNYDIFQDVPIDIFASSSGLLPPPHRPELTAKVYEDAGERYRKRWAVQAKSSASSGTSGMSGNGAQLDVSSTENVLSAGLHAGGSPFDSPIPHVPLSLPHSPHLSVQPHPPTIPGPAGDAFYDLLQAIPIHTLDDEQFGRTSLNQRQGQSHPGSGHDGKEDRQQEPRWAGWLRGEMISLATYQEASKRRGYGRKMSISQPSSPSQLNQAYRYVELGVESVYPPRHLDTWAGLTAYLQTQQHDGWLTSGPTQLPPPAKPPSPSARSAPDVSTTHSTPPSYQRDDFLAHPPASASHVHAAVAHVPRPPVTAAASAPVQERSKWDEACRRWEARGGPLAFGAGVVSTLCSTTTRRADRRVNRKVVKARIFDRTNEGVGMVTDKPPVVPRYDASYSGAGHEEVVHPPASEPDVEYQQQQPQSHQNTPPPFGSMNGTDAFANYETPSGSEDCLPQTHQPNQDLQSWSPETGCYTSSFTPTDIGVQYASSPYEYGFGHQHQHHQQAAESWTSEDHRYALVPVLMKLEADAEDLSPEQLMLMTPSQGSESFGQSSQPIDSAGMNTATATATSTAAADFGGHDVGLGLIYASQSPSGSS